MIFHTVYREINVYCKHYNMYVYEYILQHNQKNYASIKDSLVLTSKFGIDALHGALNRMQRWGPKNPGFKTRRDEFITV